MQRTIYPHDIFAAVQRAVEQGDIKTRRGTVTAETEAGYHARRRLVVALSVYHRRIESQERQQ